MQSETAERTREFHRLGVQDSRRGLAGVGYKEFKPSYQSPQRQLKPGDIGWIPPSFEVGQYRSLSPTRGRVNGLATTAAQHQKQNRFTSLPGLHWKAQEKVSAATGVLKTLPQVWWICKRHDCPQKTRNAALDALSTARGKAASSISVGSKP